MRAVVSMHTRSEPAPALVDRQREREALDGLVQDLRSGREQSSSTILFETIASMTTYCSQAITHI